MKKMLIVLMSLSMMVFANAQTIKVSNIEAARKGQLVVGVFTNEKQWPKLKDAQRVIKVDVTGDLVLVDLDLELNKRFAIMVMHDENGNQKLDINLNPFKGALGPKEGTGISSSKEVKSMPKFEDALFKVTSQDQVQQVKIQYF